MATQEELQIVLTAETKKMQAQLDKFKSNLKKSVDEISKAFNKIDLNKLNVGLNSINGKLNTTKRSCDNLVASITKISEEFERTLTKTAQLKKNLNSLSAKVVVDDSQLDNTKSHSSTPVMLSGLAMGAAVGESVASNVKEKKRYNNSNYKESVKQYTERSKNFNDELSKRLHVPDIRKLKGIFTRYAQMMYTQAQKISELDPSGKSASKLNKLDNKRVKTKEDTINGHSTKIPLYKPKIEGAYDVVKQQLQGVYNVINSYNNKIKNALKDTFKIKKPKIESIDTSNIEASMNKIKLAFYKTKFALQRGVFDVGATLGIGGLYAKDFAVKATQPFIKFNSKVNTCLSNIRSKTTSAFSKVNAALAKTKDKMLGYKSSMDKTKNSTDRLKHSTNGFLATLRRLLPFIGILTIFRGIGKSIKAGMNAIEDESLIATVFGDQAQAVKEWGDSLQSTLGINSMLIQKNAAVLFNMGKSMGMSSSDAMNLSRDMSMLAEDMASFYNISSEEAFTKIRSGLVGETEALRQLGIMVDVNTLKQYGYRDSMSSAEKMMIRYQAITAQTAVASGDLARTINSPANQLRILRNNLSLTMVSLGKCFMPVVQTILPILNILVMGINKALQAVANFMHALFGIKMTVSGGGGGLGLGDMSASVGGIDDAAGSAGDLGGNLDDATGKAKKLKGALMGFDEINKLDMGDDEGSGGSSGGGSGAGGAGGGVGSLPAISSNVNIEEGLIPYSKLANKIKELFSDIDFEPLIKSFERLQKAVEPIVKNVGKILWWFLENILAPLAKWTIEDLIPAFFNLLAAALKVLNPILESFMDVGDWLWQNFLKPIAQWTGDMIIKGLEKLTELLDKLGNWIKEHKELVENFIIIISSFAAAWGIVNTVIGIWNIIGGIAAIVTTGLAGAIAFLTSPIGIAILIIGSLIAVGVLLYKNWEKIKEKCEEIWGAIRAKIEEHGGGIKGFMGFLGDCIKEGWNQAWTKIDELTGGKLSAIKSKIEEHGGGFKGTMGFVGDCMKEGWRLTWNAIDEKTGGTLSSIKGKIEEHGGGIKGLWGAQWDAMNSMTGGKLDAIVDRVKGWGDRIKNFFSNLHLPEIKLPHIKLPHFSMSGEFSLKPLSVPKLDVNWYAKGGIIDKPSLLGMSGNSAHIAGEAGREAILPLDRNTSWMNDIADRVVSRMPQNNNQESNINLTVPINVGGELLTTKVIKDINKITRGTGICPINI